MLNYEQSCKEWIKGCSNTIGGHAEDCEECTRIFREHIEKLIKDELAHAEIEEWILREAREASDKDLRENPNYVRGSGVKRNGCCFTEDGKIFIGSEVRQSHSPLD